MKNFIFWGILLLYGCSKQDTLRDQIENISKVTDGTVGIAIEQLESGDTLSFNGTYHAPMQSVFKFPIALAVLSQVDKGTISLDQKVHISKHDLADSNTWSPMRDKYHVIDTDLTVDELLHFMVSNSDNIVCDIILKKIGGITQVNDYIHSLGINGITITANEADMHSGWDVQYTNWCEPKAMTHLLEIFYKGECLSKSSTDYLIKVMEGTVTCPKRIKGLLPEGTIVARKSGTSGKNNDLVAATNDIGVITLPSGKHLIISAFVSNSKAPDTVRDEVIAKITKLAWDKFSTQ